MANAFEVVQRTFVIKIELLAVQGHPRSSTLVPVESPYAQLSVKSLIVTLFGRISSYTVFDILAHSLKLKIAHAHVSTHNTTLV